MSPQPTTPAGRLMALRIVWAALLIGQVMFLVVILAAIRPAWTAPPPEAGAASRTDGLLYASIGMLVACAVGGFVLRMIVFNSGRDEQGLVRPSSYAVGTIIFL